MNKHDVLDYISRDHNQRLQNSKNKLLQRRFDESASNFETIVEDNVSKEIIEEWYHEYGEVEGEKIAEVSREINQ